VTVTTTTTSRSRLAVLIAIALGATLVSTLAGFFGTSSLPAMAVAAVIGFAAGLALVVWRPSVLSTLVLALIGLPLFLYLSPSEILLYVVTLVVLLAGLRVRAPWLHRLQGIELANLLLVLWAGCTVFWMHDPLRYVLGMRRLIVGWIAFACAWRLASFVPRIYFEMGVVAAALSLSLATLHRSIATGFTAGRTGGTDLGWGWANYIAALLLITVPLLVEFTVSGGERLLRRSPWVVLPLVFLVQSIIAARGALVMLVVGLAAQVVFMGRRTRVFALGVLVAGLAILFVGPFGSLIIHRFTSALELSSGAVRIWYAREGWRRTIEFFPWGMGINQGWTWPDKLYGLDAHNYWLMLSSELGVPGVLLWIVVLVLLVRGLWRMSRTPGWEGRGRALLIVFVMSQIHTMTEPNFQGPHYQLLYFWVMGGYLGYWAIDRAAGTPASIRSR